MQAGQKVALARFFNIKIKTMDGKTEIQPAAPVMVTAELMNDEAADLTDATPCAVHFAGDEPDELVKATGTDEAVTFKAEGFSVWGVVYTVDFHWDVNGETYLFSIPGGSALSLKKLVRSLLILGDADVSDNELNTFINNIDSVTFTDESLIKVAQITEDAL